MKQLISFSLILLTIIFSCNEPLDSDFEKVDVEFYLDHPTLEVTPVKFETVQKQFISKEGYHEGATFELVVESFLHRERHHFYTISNIDSINIVVDTKSGESSYIPCINYFDTAMKTYLPDFFLFRTIQKIVQDGTGTYIEPLYRDYQFEKLVDSARVITRTDNDPRISQLQSFEISNRQNIDEYLSSQTGDCLAQGNYTVRE